MADNNISEEQMDELIAAMNKSAGSLGKLADSAQTEATKKDTRTNKASNAVRQAQAQDVESTKKHSTALDKVTESIGKVAGKIAGIFTLENIASASLKYGKELTNNYREMSNYGQSFSGSLFKMAQTAAKAGLPLDSFVAALKHNSVVIGQLGATRFAELSKTVRNLTQSAGMYGYTVEQLNNVGLDYMEIQRLSGKNLSAISNDTMAHKIQGFALNITAVSDALGAQRDVVLQTTMEALQRENVMSAARLNSAKGLDAYNDAVTEATAALAAQPGVAGKMLATGLSDAFGSINGSMFTDLGREFMKVGMPAGMALIDEANARLKAGEDPTKATMEMVGKMKDQFTDAQIEQLRILSQTEGPAKEAAKSLLAMGIQIQKYTQTDIDAKTKDRQRGDALSGFMLSLGDTIEKLKGEFLNGFLAPFMTATGNFDPDKVKEFWAAVNDMGPVFRDFGTQFGDLVKTFLTPENVKMMGDTTIALIQFAAGITTGLGIVVRTVTGIFNGIHTALSPFGEKIASLGTVLAGLTAWFASKALIKAAMNMFTRTFLAREVNVSGRIVNVNGGGGGGGNGLDIEEGKGKGKGRAGKAGAVAAAEEEAAAIAGGGVGAKMEGRLQKLKMRGLSKGLKGEKLAKYMMRGVSGGGRLAAIGGRLAGAGRAMAGPLKAVGKFGGPVAAALVAGFTIADAMGVIKDVHEKVAAGEMSPLEGRKTLGKLAGSTTGSLAGSIIGGIVGQALIPIPGVGAAIGAVAGGMIGDWAGGKAGSAIASWTAPADMKAGAVAGAKVGAVGQPRIVDDRVVAQMRTDAILGDKSAVIALQQIQESLRDQTAILASQQAKNTAAVKDTKSAIQSTGGYGV